MAYSNDFTYGGNPFKSFLMGGFECADHQNAFGERIDMIKLTGHNAFLKEDYERLRVFDIRTVREGIRWSHVEKHPYQYDWTEVDTMIMYSGEAGIQVIWDICHFGFPDDLTPLHPMFPRRFAHLCKAFAEHYRSMVPDDTLIITPINEVSFLSWLGGDAKGTSPYCTTQGWEVKYCLMKAYIEGIESMKEVDPGIRIMTTEPLIHVVSPYPSDEESILKAAAKHEQQFQVLDMLSGKICPELGGKPEYLDIMGVNFYFNNQWTSTHHDLIPWGELPPHHLWKPLHTLIEEMFLRYGRPVVISETSHPGEHRPQWLDSIAEECLSMLKNGLPLYGCCIYPLIDRPDWDFPALEWHHSGIWDIYNPQGLERIPHAESIRSLEKFSRAVSDLVLSTSYEQ